MLDLSATVGFIALAILGWRKLSTSYKFWLAWLLLYSLLTSALTRPDTLQSNQHFVLEIFPVFFILAGLGIKHPRLHQALMLAFPVLLATLSMLFLANRWLV